MKHRVLFFVVNVAESIHTVCISPDCIRAGIWRCCFWCMHTHVSWRPQERSTEPGLARGAEREETRACVRGGCFWTDPSKGARYARARTNASGECRRFWHAWSEVALRATHADAVWKRILLLRDRQVSVFTFLIACQSGTAEKRNQPSKGRSEHRIYCSDPQSQV